MSFAERKKKRDKDLNFSDKFKSGFVPAENREAYLDERAEANRKAKEAEERERRRKESEGRANRRQLSK